MRLDLLDAAIGLVFLMVWGFVAEIVLRDRKQNAKREE